MSKLLVGKEISICIFNTAARITVCVFVCVLLSLSYQLGLNHVCVILSRRVILSHLRDTMYHTDMILYLRHVFDTLKSICEMCSLRILANAYISSTMFNFDNCFFLKKSKYHVCVILSHLCDTVNVNVMDVQVSRRCDSITQT